MGDPNATWDLYRTFLAVVQERSFSGAARQLGSTQPTVGRQIERLEQELGVSLFTRSPRGLLATAVAQQLVPHAEAMATSAAVIVRLASVKADETSGTVRLTAGEHVGLEVLPAILATFAAQHPQIDIELSLTNRNENILLQEADIAVRMGRPVQKSLVARRIGIATIGLFAHRRYVERFGLPKTPADLPDYRFIGFDKDFSVLRSQGGRAANILREEFRFRTDYIGAQLAALRAGVGIAACHNNVARRDPDLVPVLAHSLQFEREIWLLMHENAKAVPRIRLMFDHLAEGLTAYVNGKSPPRTAANADRSRDAR